MNICKCALQLSLYRLIINKTLFPLWRDVTPCHDLREGRRRTTSKTSHPDIPHHTTRHTYLCLIYHTLFLVLLLTVVIPLFVQIVGKHSTSDVLFHDSNDVVLDLPGRSE
jgi:hypothetical protein